MAKKDLFHGNVLPAPLNPPNTGNAAADEAIRKLQAWEMNPYTPVATPTGKDYDAAVKVAEKAGPTALLALLDDAALATGQSFWSDAHLAGLGAADRKVFKKHYDAVVAAIAVRGAYLTWLVGAVCRTPEGLKRALEVARTGTSTARLVTGNVLARTLTTPEQQKQFAAAIDPAEWNGKDQALERLYRSAVIAFSNADPKAAFDRWAPLLAPAAFKKPGGRERASAVLYGLMNAKARDPRWAKQVLPALDDRQLDNQALMLLEKLPPDPVAREAIHAFLPKPTDLKAYWNQTAIKVLGRIADRTSLPWLIGALKASWMNWPAAFEGFRVAGDPAMVNVIREWLEKNDAPDRRQAAGPILKELEAKGPVPAAGAPQLDPPPEPKRKRPVLEFKKAKPFASPRIDPLAKQTKEIHALFEKAGLGKHKAAIPQRALWLIPKRVDETKLKALGGSKLGGHPDLAVGAAWPRVKGTPLTFLAQLDLAEAAPLLPKGALPKDGLLSFFVGEDFDGPAGYCEHGAVLHTPAKAKLARQAVPDDYFGRIYQAATVALREAWSLPAANNQHLTKALKGVDREKYGDVLFDQPMLPQLLGYRNHGYDAELPATAQMLLQLPGDNQTDMEFGDADALSFFVDAKRLAKGDFSKVTMKLGD